MRLLRGGLTRFHSTSIAGPAPGRRAPPPPPPVPRPPPPPRPRPPPARR
ncbi:MAG: hypothetical protein IPO58_03085 [Betaproteobacteria bacterium]|nr:hypothetical protein [Betaproteobacteria bacterium]